MAFGSARAEVCQKKFFKHLVFNTHESINLPGEMCFPFIIFLHGSFTTFVRLHMRLGMQGD